MSAASQGRVVESESGAVPYLRPSAYFARTAVHRGLLFAGPWTLLAALDPIAVGGFLNSIPSAPGDPAVLGFLLLAVLGPIAQIPLGLYVLLPWRAAVRLLAESLPSDSTWRAHFSDRLKHSASRVTALAATACVLLALSMVWFWVLAASVASTGVAAPPPWELEALGLLLLGTAAATWAGEVAGTEGLLSLIRSSEIPAIDLDLDRGRQLVRWTAPTVLVPPVLFIAGAVFPAAAPGLWPFAWIGVVAPIGLLVALSSVRDGYERWIALAERLGGLA